MPILLRKPGESVNISDDLVITVLEINGDQVRFGLDNLAKVDDSDEPDNESSKRAEVYARIFERDCYQYKSEYF